jgi:hypothetical protein
VRWNDATTTPTTHGITRRPNDQCRVLDQAHRKRNLAEYEGDVDVDVALVEAVLRVLHEMERRIADLDLPEGGPD